MNSTVMLTDNTQNQSLKDGSFLVIITDVEMPSITFIVAKTSKFFR